MPQCVNVAMFQWRLLLQLQASLGIGNRQRGAQEHKLANAAEAAEAANENVNKIKSENSFTAAVDCSRRAGGQGRGCRAHSTGKVLLESKIRVKMLKMRNC